MPIKTSRVHPEEWELLKEVRLSALHDSPSAFGSTYGDEVERSDEFWKLRATQASKGKDLATFFARTKPLTVGIVSGYRPAETPNDVELVSMWTSPRSRRAGAGRLLVREIIDWATEGDARSVGLWVMSGNADAERLYTSIGFHADVGYQPRPSDPCADQLRMSLPLLHRN